MCYIILWLLKSNRNITFGFKCLIYEVYNLCLKLGFVSMPTVIIS